MRWLLGIFAPFLIGCIGLYAFTSLNTAVIFVLGFSLLVYSCMRYWEQHQGEGKGDSRLSDMRMELARQWWVREVKRERERDGKQQ